MFTNLGIAWAGDAIGHRADYVAHPMRVWRELDFGLKKCGDGRIERVTLTVRIILEDSDPDPAQPEPAFVATSTWDPCLHDPNMHLSTQATYRTTSDSLFLYGLQPDSLVMFVPRMPWADRPNRLTISAARLFGGELTYKTWELGRHPPLPLDTVTSAVPMAGPRASPRP